MLVSGRVHTLKGIQTKEIWTKKIQLDFNRHGWHMGPSRAWVWFNAFNFQSSWFFVVQNPTLPFFFYQTKSTFFPALKIVETEPQTSRFFLGISQIFERGTQSPLFFRESPRVLNRTILVFAGFLIFLFCIHQWGIKSYTSVKKKKSRSNKGGCLNMYIRIPYIHPWKLT